MLMFISTLILSFVTKRLSWGECRSRSDCTYVQSDLGLHSPRFYRVFLSLKSPLMQFYQLKYVCEIVNNLNSTV